ncbi:ProQ/FINO family protein [Gammaproteobacteria bacterium]|nr:ProQ/FINO family protein [Gammaproteobacteria bacterium]
MSNLTLKEQLEALSSSSSSVDSFVEKKMNSLEKNKPPQNSGSKINKKPAWLEQAKYGVELLKAYFPNCFGEIKDIKPLKIGIKQDLVKYLSTREDIVLADKACMVTSLSYYVSSPAYHKNVVNGVNRIDLNGNNDGIITPEEAKYSLECRKIKMDKKKKKPNLSEKNIT